MKRHFMLPLLAFAAMGASAQITTDTIPTRAIVLTGNPDQPSTRTNVAILYSRANLAFRDPAAPRFLLLDKKGKVALGIGGYVKAVGEYDFGGVVSNTDCFDPHLIDVPRNPANKERLAASVAHSTVFLKLVTSPTRLGRVIVYVQTNFTGNNYNYGVYLDQAYATVGHVTVGKARSTFADPAAMAPTIDDQGPAGEVTTKNLLVQYASPSYKGFSYAISAELPSAKYTLGEQAKAIPQRFPDIPAYVQYAWGKNADNHIRAAGILRRLSYRDEAAGANRFVTGWGVQMSTVAAIVGRLKFFGEITYGKGIAHYINDLSGQGYDLVYSTADGGSMKAPAALGWSVGLQHYFTDNVMMSAAYSQTRLFDSSALQPDTYRNARYLAANIYYRPLDDLRLGLEYLYGSREDINGLSGHANRLQAMVQYSF
ncbi:MAG: porin [Muribaculaceae bacterium]|nr:porin [Muribaculaceae bacterium]